jgi:hypothetical protein
VEDLEESILAAISNPSKVKKGFHQIEM